ncbi:MAG: site-2 protease family protein [Fibrobacter sp.]|nr:site-2 protease family protein [Fibrobacter sp.]
MSQEVLRTGTLYLLALVISLSFHEFAHAWAAMKCGDNTAKSQGRLTLNPLRHLDFFGTIMLVILAYQGIGLGWAKPVPVDASHLKKRALGLISLLGPVSNLVLALVFYQLFVVFRLVSDFPLPPNAPAVLGFDFLMIAIQVNLTLFVFNLIPVFPLDGAKVLSGLLPAALGRRCDAFFARFGIFPLLFLILWEWILPFPGPISLIFKEILPFLLSALSYTSFWTNL